MVFSVIGLCCSCFALGLLLGTVLNNPMFHGGKKNVKQKKDVE